MQRKNKRQQNLPSVLHAPYRGQARNFRRQGNGGRQQRLTIEEPKMNPPNSHPLKHAGQL
jgi:hypothetical protein